MRGAPATGIIVLLALLGVSAPAIAAECPGNPDAIGTSRTIVIDPTEYRLLGGLQYDHSLPLADKEVVLTFDDGPLPPYTNRVLDILASECAKATFFLVGRMAHEFSTIVRRIYDAGHTVANHSQNHPLHFHTMPLEKAAREIETGHASIQAALGERRPMSPFFRIPGLLRQEAVEQYLASQGYMTWSVDFLADDWRRISADEVVRRALRRIEAKGRGILLLHDIQPATALGLLDLLKALKAHGYRIVHVVPSGPNRPKTVTRPEQWALPDKDQAPRKIWPRVATVAAKASADLLVAPNPESFGIALGPDLAIAKWNLDEPQLDRARGTAAKVPLPPIPLWPRSFAVIVKPIGANLPVPAELNFQYTEIPRSRIAAFAAHKSLAKRRAPAPETETTQSIPAIPAVTTALYDPGAIPAYPMEGQKSRATSGKRTTRTPKSKEKDRPLSYWNVWASWASGKSE